MSSMSDTKPKRAASSAPPQHKGEENRGAPNARPGVWLELLLTALAIAILYFTSRFLMTYVYDVVTRPENNDILTGLQPEKKKEL